MTCRVSLLKEGRPKAPVACADCGACGLEDFYTSQDRHDHLCPACFQARTALGAAREADEPHSLP